MSACGHQYLVPTASGTASSSARSSPLSAMSAAATFSSRYGMRLVPGIGITCSPWASVHASATWPGVAPWRSATRRTASTIARLASSASLLEARPVAPRVAVLQRVARGQPAGEEAAAQRRERHEGDAVGGAERQHLGQRVARPQRQLALHGGDRVDGVGARELVARDLRQADRPRLAGRDDLGQRADALLDRDLRVGAVQVVEVDVVDARGARSEPSIAGADVLGRAVAAAGCRSRGPRPRSRTWSPASPRRGGPATARPTSSSLVYGPYMSAVSISVQPRSIARWIDRLAVDALRAAVGPGQAHGPVADRPDLGAVVAERSRAHRPTIGRRPGR